MSHWYNQINLHKREISLVSAYKNYQMDKFAQYKGRNKPKTGKFITGGINICSYAIPQQFSIRIF